MNNNIIWHSTKVTSEDREKLKNHKSLCLWFTGLSGSGKSTVANELEKLLYRKNIHTYILDGDNIRHGLNSNLDFSTEGRKENIRRIGEVAKLFVDTGIVVLTAFISPYRKDRDSVRNLLPDGKFIEVYVECDLKTCESRDPKGLYKKAREGEINDFTGISAPYEAPSKPEVTINTAVETDPVKNAEVILKYLEEENYLTL